MNQKTSVRWTNVKLQTEAVITYALIHQLAFIVTVDEGELKLYVELFIWVLFFSRFLEIKSLRTNNNQTHSTHSTFQAKWRNEKKKNTVVAKNCVASWMPQNHFFCVLHTMWPFCRFHSYELQGNTTCVDIDECKTPGTCSQFCTNEIGSYKVICFSTSHRRRRPPFGISLSFFLIFR